MNCREFDRLLCDYLDDTLDREQRREMDTHRLGCTACAEAVAEADFAVTVMRLAPTVEPPPQLIADIIHDTVGVGSGVLTPAGPSEGLPGFLRPFLQPFLQPRFVMSMAMTALSFSMLTAYGQQALERWQSPAPSATVEMVSSFGESVSELWREASVMVESARELYRLQTEFTEEPATAPAEGGP